MERYTDDNPAVKLPCSGSHEMHLTCYLQSKRLNGPKCPICRDPIPSFWPETRPWGSGGLSPQEQLRIREERRQLAPRLARMDAETDGESGSDTGTESYEEEAWDERERTELDDEEDARQARSEAFIEEQERFDA